MENSKTRIHINEAQNLIFALKLHIKCSNIWHTVKQHALLIKTKRHRFWARRRKLASLTKKKKKRLGCNPTAEIYNGERI